MCRSVICAQCGQPFQSNDPRRLYCSPEHKRKFFEIEKTRGAALTALVQTHRTGKRGRSDLATFSMRTISALADKWNAEDKASGRRPDLVVARKMAAGFCAHDVG